MIALKRKSAAPAPPCSSATAIPVKPWVPACRVELARHDPVALPLLLVGDDLGIQEAAHALPEGLLLVVVEGAAHLVSLVSEPWSR